MTIVALVDMAHATAVAKGWAADLDPNGIAAKLCLIHSEVSEALECLRDGEMEMFMRGGIKPEGFGVELADIVIRVADLAGALNIDLAEMIAVKMEYNLTRTHRHGGKAL